MLAIAANRTLTHFGHRHFCRRHGKLLDKNHIDECSILNPSSEKKVTYYNATLEKTSLHDLKEAELREVIDHYARLDTVINIYAREDSKVFLAVRDSVRLN